MGRRELILSFEGPGEDVSPARSNVRPLLLVQLRFVELVERIAQELESGDDPSFAMVMKELRKGSVQAVYDFVSSRPGVNLDAARKAGLSAAELVPKYLESRDTGSPGLKKCVSLLAKAVSDVPESVAVHLRGKVTACLSELAKHEPKPAASSMECFRATILKAGGFPPRVQLKVWGAERTITIDAPQDLATLAGRTLYEEADVTAQIERAADGRILHGRMYDLRILDNADPIAAFDQWYTKIGKPWARVKDIEGGLGRGRDET